MDHITKNPERHVKVASASTALLVADLEAIEERLRETAKVGRRVLGSTPLVSRIISDADWLGRVIARAKGAE